MGHALRLGYQLCTAHLAVAVCKQILIDIGGLHQAKGESTEKRNESTVLVFMQDINRVKKPNTQEQVP